MEISQINIRTQRLVAIVAVVLFVLKIAAWMLTNSVAILTDALESTVNVITGFTGLYSLRLAAKPRDKNHPYGHGKVELLSASFEGALILVAAVLILFESVSNLVKPHAVNQLDYGIMLISITAIANYLLGYYCIRIGEKNHSIALVASGKHLQSDTWSTLGIVVGLGLVLFTKIAWIDSVVAIIAALFILYEGYKIIRQSAAGITDEADQTLLERLVSVLNARKKDTWIDVHNLRVIKYGAVLHVDCHVTLPWYLNVNEAHAEIDQLDALIREEFPQSIEMFVHTDGCVPPGSCEICPIKDCQVRQAAFVKRLTWTFENITHNQKHGVGS